MLLFVDVSPLYGGYRLVKQLHKHPPTPELEMTDLRVAAANGAPSPSRMVLHPCSSSVQFMVLPTDVCATFFRKENDLPNIS
jgi:hypothetical protein